jgi:hypothetical protein
MPVNEIPAPAPMSCDELGAKEWVEDDLVARLFGELESALDKQRANEAAAMPATLSRLARRVQHIEDCEVHWRPALRGAGIVLRFAAGCCHYPGMGFDQDLADRALGGLAEIAQGEERPDFVVMLGDQVYADATAGVLDLDEGLEKYSTRYDAGFGARPFRELTSRLPTYMLADDHELRDGWPNDLRPGPGTPAPHWDRSAWWAWGLYVLHQRWHGPERPRWWTGASAARGERASLWYAFDDNQVPFFAFDARFQRERQPRSIVGREQMEAFRQWLVYARGREQADPALRHVPKFVMSGSVIAPGLQLYEDEEGCARRGDNWQAYARERAQLARYVAESGLQNVVLLSGDYHCAAIAALEFRPVGEAPTRGYAIVAPPLYAPFPFANARADDISAAGCIAWQKRHIASCRAEGRPVQGFALVKVLRAADRGTPDDWEVRVDFMRDRWEGEAPALEACARARLAGGEAKFL